MLFRGGRLRPFRLLGFEQARPSSGGALVRSANRLRPFRAPNQFSRLDFLPGFLGLETRRLLHLQQTVFLLHFSGTGFNPAHSFAYSDSVLYQDATTNAPAADAAYSTLIKRQSGRITMFHNLIVWHAFLPTPGPQYSVTKHCGRSAGDNLGQGRTGIRKGVTIVREFDRCCRLQALPFSGGHHARGRITGSTQRQSRAVIGSP